MKAVTAAWCRGLVAAALLAVAPALGGEGTVGLGEECDDVKGWYDRVVPGRELPPMRSENGRLVIETRRTQLRFAQGRSWVAPGIQKSAILCKDFGEIDLDKYHYFVVKIDRKGSSVYFGVNGFDTKCGYTTGITAIDLRDYADERIHGRQTVRLELDLHENTTTQVIDHIRLVSELTPDEKKRFIPAGVKAYHEKLTAEPYHGLEALLARCGAPLVPFDGAEQVVFEDTATHAVVRRLTANPISDSLGVGGLWSADGAGVKRKVQKKLRAVTHDGTTPGSPP